MKIFIGADHGGFKLKEKIVSWLQSLGHEVFDMGAARLNPDDDYPDIAFKVAEEVVVHSKKSIHDDALDDRQTVFGILMCRSSAGMVIAANKVRGARAVSVMSPEQAIHARQHNNAHIVALAGDAVDPDTARACIESFLNTPFSGEERHLRRVAQITKYETTHLAPTGTIEQ